MALSNQQLVSRIGETDQQFLQDNSPQLALLRAQLRLDVVTQSRMRQERLHFLQEAIVLLEQARIEYDEMPMSLYLQLSLQLAKAYMVYFELTQEQRFAIIVQQILKPLAHWKKGEIYYYLAYTSAIQQEYALARHWLNKYGQSSDFDADKLRLPIFDFYALQQPHALTAVTTSTIQ